MEAEFFCFEIGNNYYAFDTIRLIPMQLSKKSYHVLRDLSNDLSSNGQVDLKKYLVSDELIALSNQNILFHNKKFEVNNSFRELSLSLIPSQSCNLNCKYCYAGETKTDKVMKPNTVRDTIRFFCKNFPFSTCRVDFVSGGEPLYDVDSLLEMIKIVSEELNLYGKTPLFWLCSNGLLINEKILQRLDEYNFNLGISLDGPQEVNDANRQDLAGNGTYNKVVQKISSITQNDALSRNIRNLWNCAVITTRTKSLVDIMQNSYNLGFRNLQMKTVWSNDDSIRLKEKVTIQLYKELTHYLFKLIEQKRLDEFLCICNENDTYGKVLLRLIIQSGVTRRCNAGVNKFSLSPEGKIYPCDSFLDEEKYCLGDIYNGFKKNLAIQFSRMRNSNIQKCRVCWAKYLCGGDCFYHAYLNTESPSTPDNRTCAVMTEIAKLCIVLVVNLYRTFPGEMRKIYSVLSKKAMRMEPRL